MRTKYLLPVFILSVLFTSCDPVHNVGFINESNEPIMIKVLITDNFQSTPGMILNVIPGKDSAWAKFYVYPGDTVICGQTIAEIDDEMPYTQLDIYYPNDSIHYENEEEIKKLYGDTFWDDPYMIELE